MKNKELQEVKLPINQLCKSISRFSVETAGTFDLDAELKIWVSSETNPSIVKQFNKSVNVYDVQSVLAHHVLS